MSVFKPRTRVVSFRVSDEEYTGLREICQAQRVRSISGFARSATLQCVETGTDCAAETLPFTIRQLNGKVKQLEAEVERLARLVGQTSFTSTTG